MFTAGDPGQGMAGYVAIEVSTGSLDAREGRFALQHSAAMDANGGIKSVIVVPGSGTGDMAGISGEFGIEIVNGWHEYDLSYGMPD